MPSNSRSRQQFSFGRLLWIWLPSVLAVTAIVLESTVQGGAAYTGGPLRRLWTALFGAVSDHAWDTIHFLIRKLGHFSGYGLSSAMFFRSFFLSLRGRLVDPIRLWAFSCLYALIGTLLLASADEFHQSFLPGRQGTPIDVLLDQGGAWLVQIVIALVIAFRLSAQNARRRAVTV